MTNPTPVLKSSIKTAPSPRSLFGVASGVEASVVRDMLEIADDLLSEVSVALVHGPDPDISKLETTLLDASKWLLAAESALVIIENPDWSSDLEMARAGLMAVGRLKRCLASLATPFGLE